MKNVDLNVHATREFTRAETGKLQGNLVKDIVDKCIREDIGICAVTNLGNGHSELSKKYIQSLPEGYNYEDIGKGVHHFRVEEDNVYLVESHINHVDRIGEMGIAFDCLVIGRSNNMVDGPIRIISKPEVPAWNRGSYGLSSRVDRGYFAKFHAVEGHNATLSSKTNDYAQELAYDLNMSTISTSGAERIGHIGNGYFTVNSDWLDFSNGDTLLRTLRWNLDPENGGTLLPNYQGRTFSLGNSLKDLVGYN